MNTQELQHLVAEALDDLKALDVNVLEVSEMTSITDVMFVCSGRSTRHVKSIADNVVKEAKKNKMPPIGVEGNEKGEWILIDLGDVIVHVMKPEIREFYKLEDLWETQPEG